MIIETQIDNISEFLPAIALPHYLKLQSSDFGYFVSDENIIIPFIVKSRMGIKWLVLTTSPLNCKNNFKAKIFIEEIIQYARKKNFAYLTCANHALYNFYPLGSKHCIFGTYKVNLEVSEEELFQNLHSKHRNVIRKAEKDRIQIFHGVEYKKECISVIIDTQERQGIKSHKSSLSYLQKLNENVEYWIAKDQENNIQGSAIFLWNKNHSSYYIYGGSNLKHHNGALNLLHWKAMLHMKKEGVKYFDFVGARVNPSKESKFHGIQLFKSRFGSVLFKGYLFKLILSPRYYFLQILFNINSILRYRKIYKGDMIDQEIKRANLELKNNNEYIYNS